MAKLDIINGKYEAEEDKWFLTSFEDWKNRNGNPDCCLTYNDVAFVYVCKGKKNSYQMR